MINKLIAVLLIVTGSAFATDKADVVVSGVLAGAMAFDAYSTQKSLQAGNRELNPIARPFVNKGWTGQALVSTVSFAGVYGASRFLTLHGHHRWGLFVPVAVAGVSLVLGFRNMRLAR